MIGEAITLGIIVAALGGYTFYDNHKVDRHAKANEEEFRQDALELIDRSGLDIVDFPKYEDALRGERHLKVGEIVDIQYICRTRRRK